MYIWITGWSNEKQIVIYQKNEQNFNLMKINGFIYGSITNCETANLVNGYIHTQHYSKHTFNCNVSLIDK